jgi:hypothetical protein
MWPYDRQRVAATTTALQMSYVVIETPTGVQPSFACCFRGPFRFGVYDGGYPPARTRVRRPAGYRWPLPGYPRNLQREATPAVPKTKLGSHAATSGGTAPPRPREMPRTRSM